ncbi:hypothetical protein ABZ612_37310 [Streptomyces avermitilis]|uniref:hypothetical protein n=1 Tax=Streptomyces avermitilis TaxID=33903 RepID=UPI0033C9C48F
MQTTRKSVVSRPRTGWAKARHLRGDGVRTCVSARDDGERTCSSEQGVEENIVRGED